MRAETGPMQFDGDWRGVFIRGDNALMGYLPILEIIKDYIKDEPLIQLQLQGLISLLKSAEDCSNDDGIQKMKAFEQCKINKLPVVK